MAVVADRKIVDAVRLVSGRSANATSAADGRVGELPTASTVRHRALRNQDRESEVAMPRCHRPEDRRPRLHRDARLDGRGDRGGARRLGRAQDGVQERGAAPAAPGQDALHALPRQVDPDPQRLRVGHDPARRPRDLPRRREDAGRARGEPEGHGRSSSPATGTASRSGTTSRRTRATRGCARSPAGPTSR